MEPFIGQIQAFGFNFAPRGWALCNGQLLSIAQNTALFSLLGTTYGGDGQTTFALPNLQGRVMIHQGNLPGGGSYQMGQTSGVENAILNVNQMPIHNHIATATSILQADNTAATTGNPNNKVLAQNASTSLYVIPDTSLVNMAPQAVTTSVTVATAGGSQPFSVLQPFLVVNVCIATEGIFPSRN